LLGILLEGSVAASLLAQGATPERVRAELLCLMGKNEPVSHTNTPLTPLTPHSQCILTMAGELAREHSAIAISPDYILQAVVREKGGLAVHILRSIGVTLDPWWVGAKLPSPQEEERYIRTLEERIAQRPRLDEAEELRLAHLIARGKAEQRRAELLAERADAHLIEEGDAAYFQLIPACQHLVLAVAREYFGPGRNAREIIAAGNDGLSLAAISFGLKQQIPFRTYAVHMIHIQIIRALG
jgi:DNA-directed RNA polymerase, sigma subunit (sigma70/sigma32)